MFLEILLFCLLIIAARIADVTLGTLRTVSIFRGLRGAAFALGFFESLIWLTAITHVTSNLNEPVYMVAFALGFAVGNYVGLTIERSLAVGEQVIRVFSRESHEMAKKLREAGHGVTIFKGEGKEGPVDMLFMRVDRRKSKKVIQVLREVDPKSYFIIDDIVGTSDPAPPLIPFTGWRARSLRK